MRIIPLLKMSKSMKEFSFICRFPWRQQVRSAKTKCQYVNTSSLDLHAAKSMQTTTLTAINLLRELEMTDLGTGRERYLVRAA